MVNIRNITLDYDNVSYFIEQTDAKYEDAYHYKVLFRPEEIIPDIKPQTSNK